ncbi:ataxia telangiectasia mutated [Xylogone sp. PMI_703]|nr:ataxia telangiectasia mutated [Xylogone sp. PMI_703]
MGQSSGDKGEIRLDHVLASMQSDTQRQRAEGIKNLKSIFDRTHKTVNLDVLTDKAYHKIYEVLFKFALHEKQSFLTAKRNTTGTAASRLAYCGDVFRATVKAGASKLRWKTVEAVVDHIVQTLPNTDGEYCEPISQHYLKALGSVFEHRSNVEHLRTSKWLEVVDFCLQGIKLYLEKNGTEVDGIPSSAGSGAQSSGFGSLVRSSAGRQTLAGSLSRQNVEDLLHCLAFLVSAPNCPLLERVDNISSNIVHFLQSQGSSVSQMHQLAFSILNSVLIVTVADRTSFSQSLARDALPIISRLWQGRAIAKDEMLNSVRDEMLIVLLTTHLHLERSLRDEGPASDLTARLKDLLITLRVDYARRSDRDQLQLTDLDMDDLGLDATNDRPFRLQIFSIRPHNKAAERNWAILYLIGLLERLVKLEIDDNVNPDVNDDHEVEQPRKRRRLERQYDALLDPILSEDMAAQLAALQTIPFVLHHCDLPPPTLTKLLSQLNICASDKKENVRSWALLAIASCAHQPRIRESSADWLHLWHVGIRCVIYPTTCRAASILLHSILSQDIIKHSEVSEDINAIITTSDTNGPAVLCDSALFLMMHLLHTRITEVPGASLAASQNVIRWLFTKWNPADKSFATQHDPYLQPWYLIQLLRICFGLSRLNYQSRDTLPWGPVVQAWQRHISTRDILKYLLLLDDIPASKTKICCPSCPQYTEIDTPLYFTETTRFHVTRKLALEHIMPKVSDLLQGSKSADGDRSTQITADTLRCTINACLVALLLTSYFTVAPPSPFSSFEADLKTLVDEIVALLDDSNITDLNKSQSFTEITLQCIRLYLPAISSNELNRLFQTNSHLQRFFAVIAEKLDHGALRAPASTLGLSDDLMDIDEEFVSQRSSLRIEVHRGTLPREDLSLKMSAISFYNIINRRLKLVAALSMEPEVDSIPSIFINQLLAKTDEEVLSCRSLIQEVLQSGLLIDDADANRLVLHAGEIIASDEYERCEIALMLCLEILVELVPKWSSSDSNSLSESASELYQWFVQVAFPNGITSSNVEKTMAILLFHLMETREDYGAALTIPSPRSTLFEIIQQSNIAVKFYISIQISHIFELFILKEHDNVFVDILQNLPSDPDWIEGIAYRLFVLSKLASRWSTLLRRCIYHIFETPGRIPKSKDHATRCLANVSSALQVDGPRELFELFSPQLLYTWLETEAIEDMPYEIFGFSSLKDLLDDAKHEATALMIMRGQDDAATRLATALGLTLSSLLQQCFSKTIAYSIAHDISTPRSDTTKKTGEARVRKQLGSELYFECVNLHFVDIVATLFNIIDQEDNIERTFLKNEKLAYAAKVIVDIKAMGSSDVTLPPNQQPTFKAKYLTSEIQHLCSRTVHEIEDLYTPSLVVFVARKLLNTIHPSLGSLHACAVLRKLRILISLAGDAAVQGYPLEMLLQSITPFITDPECSQDAIGLVQYLLTYGHSYLVQTPTFVAGTALTVLGPLRVFLQSGQASTTHDTQHKITMSKAQQFHGWVGDYLNAYESPLLKGSPKAATFYSIVQSAHGIRSSGNAQIGSLESNLLLKLLEDEKDSDSLLNPTSRKLALSMLCSEFEPPANFRDDIFGNDDIAISSSVVVWKSCENNTVNKRYLAWAARVLGRAFVASGNIHEELLQESSLKELKRLSRSSKEGVTSNACILGILQALTLNGSRRVVGMAEIALRVIVTMSDETLAVQCQKNLPESLCIASAWAPYQIPPSETRAKDLMNKTIDDPFNENAIDHPDWLRDLTIALVDSVKDDILLQAIIPILANVPEFSTQIFPFVLHLVLSNQFQNKQSGRKQLSDAFTKWFGRHEFIDKNKLRMLINSILYLRTQPLPEERSSADRLHWLDLDYTKTANAASACGMFKTALLFIEESVSEGVKSRRDKTKGLVVGSQVDDTNELLLKIYQGIDDPDLYYGVQQSASLSTILARLEYERDGSRSLAFRGAQYDSHLRQHNPESADDADYLVRALDMLNLSGLSHSLLQTQQNIGMNSASADSMFRTARKLEQWDIPVPNSYNNNAVTIYKAFQTIHTSIEREQIVQGINEGLCLTMESLVQKDLTANSLHDSLQTLAVLVELDELVCAEGSNQIEEMLSRYQNRSSWMKTGRFEDISQILSCRGTALSSLSQQPRLQRILSISSTDARLVEVQTALLSSGLNRAHGAHQESLSLATSLIDLIQPCKKVGLSIEAAAHLEAANALWDQGEVTAAIGMLQSLEASTSFKNQSIPVGRSDLLAKVGYHVSVARLEKPDQIIERYLKPALEELRGKNDGGEAGQVFHQFAIFCDQQLQDPNNVEDLERLRKLSQMKESEVNELAKMLKNATSSMEKAKYKGHYAKAKQWLSLDEQELRRHISSRDEFLRQSLENYLLALSASDDHDNDALRFTALWFEHSGTKLANEAVSRQIARVPSRKFAALMNQLTSRLLDTSEDFQQLLFSLVMRICIEHPYHGMYQIYAGTSSRANSKDEAAVSRYKVTTKVGAQLTNESQVGLIWSRINATSKGYCLLAGEKNDQRYRAGRKIALKDSPAGARFSSILPKYPTPAPTMHISLAPDLDYSKVPTMTKLDSHMTIASGVSAPKIITVIASNGARYKQLVKGGNDDLRQDAIMEQVFAQVSELLKVNRSTRQRNLGIRTYKVLPLTSTAGVIEFVPNTIPLHEYLMPAHERFYPKDLKGNQCRKEIGDVQTQPLDVRIKKYRSVIERFHPVMRYFFMEKFDDPDEWFVKRLAYTRSTAAISMLGHVLGLGDRHGHNILLDAGSGEVVHIDLGVAFEMGRVLPVPELVPFRLTRDIVDGMGITKTEGVFRRCCEFTLEALRNEVYSIMTILDVLRYDPLYSWSISPVRLAKLQDAQSVAPGPVPTISGETNGRERPKGLVNEPSEADRALTVVNKKLSKTLSVSATVNDLINQATDERNLAVLYSGWAAYA